MTLTLVRNVLSFIRWAIATRKSTPRGDDGHDCEQTYFEDLEDAVPAIVVVSAMLVVFVLLGERVSDLNVGPLGHAPTCGLLLLESAASWSTPAR